MAWFRILAGGLTATLAVPAAAQIAPTRVSVENGMIQGHVIGGVVAFKGVPYATPPVGALRWRSPQPAKRWTGVLNADAFGHDCMQRLLATALAPILTEPSEDCLVMNVWRPAEAGNTKLPVMVYIYGGGFARGGSSSTVYGGDAFARRGVVMVSFNYRVGRLGFFGFPALTAEDPGELKGNYGFMDQLAALKWVQRNIAAFGGDPGNVTIFGESAGGASVHALVTSPLAKGLFHKAIVQSGGGRDNLLGGRPLSGGSPASPSAETIGLTFARSKGISGEDTAALARLRALPAREFADLDAGTTRLPDGREVWGGPVIDGRLVVERQETAYRSGRFNRIPMMVGATDADLGALPADAGDAAFARFPNQAAARKAYASNGEPGKEVARRVGVDAMMIEPARFIAETVSGKGLPVYEFRFSYVPPALAGRWTDGAVHAAELPYVFDTVAPYFGPAVAPADLRLAETVNRYWANFAKTGDPNSAGLPQWPRYEPRTDMILEFRPGGQVIAAPDPLKPRLDLASAYAEAQTRR